MSTAMASETVNDETNSETNVVENESMVVEDLAGTKKKMANRLYQLKQYKKALAVYNEVIEMCPNVAQYYGNRSACYIMLSQYHDALTDAKKCIELDSDFLKAYLRVIKCSLTLGNLIEAESTLLQLHEKDPTDRLITTEQYHLLHVQKYSREAEVAYEAKNYRKVIFCMDRCRDVSTYCTRFKLTKAECLAFLGRYQEAQEIANDVLHVDKQNADAMYIRGMCLYYQDNVERAVSNFQQALLLAPDHTKALEIYKKAKYLKKKKEEGNAAFKKEQYQVAYDLYNEALTIDPKNTATNAKLHFNKATVAVKLGRLNESISECTTALKLDENYLKALLRRAASYMELKEYEDAVRDLDRVCKMDKNREYKRLLLEAQLALKKSKRKDYYKILGIDKTASTDDIKKAYRKRAKVHHPDRHANATEGEKKEQEKKFKEVGEAYGILSDPKKRSRYDSGHDLDDDFEVPDIDPNSMFQNLFGHHGGYQHGCQFQDACSFAFQFA